MRIPGLALAALVALGCQSGERPALHISNGTTLDVAVFVNGVQAAIVPPGGPAPNIDSTILPPLPWDVVARAPTGRVLTTMHVAPGQVVTTTRPDGGMSSRFALARVDLSCGTLVLYAGDVGSFGPAPGAHPGQPGDCAP